MQRIGVLTGRAEGFNLPALRFLVLQLNRLQSSFEYEFLRTDDFKDQFLDDLVDRARVDREEIRKKVPAFITKFTTHLEEKNKKFLLQEPPPNYFILLTLAKYKDNYYSMREARMSVLALGNWDARMAPPTILEFVLTLILRDSLAAACPGLSGSVHAGTKGCLCDFTEYQDETRFKALEGFVCNHCRGVLGDFQNVADDITRILGWQWLGEKTDPGSPAGILSKLGYDLFLTKGLKRVRDKILNTLREEITKDVVRIFVELLIAALLLWLGLKPSVAPHSGTPPSAPELGSVFTFSALYLTVGSLILVGGVYLASRSSKGAKVAGALAASAGALTIGFTLVKDFKLFGSLVDKVVFNLGHQPPPILPRIDSAARFCIVGPFGDGDAHLQPQTKGGARDLALRASQCAQQVTSGSQNDSLLQVTIVGHVDARELGRQSSRNYGSNFNLAYQRAIAVLALLNVAHERTSVLVAGPQHVGPDLDDAQLADDRSVEVRTILLSASTSSKGPP